ncbi:ino eighty subunit 1 [Sarocladium implicatum]|nr:ino eighty subunit 1 [Sarocladium implicatum]
MAASPASVAATSEIDHPSSPGVEAKSFVSRVADDDEDTRMGDATPDPDAVREASADKPARGKGKGTGKDAAGQIGKIRHLKKDDGEPLWRVDIQYDFLKAVFDNEDKVFTNTYDDSLPPQDFADLYIDTMSRSSKTSKVLRDKLLSDREAAKGMAMVCLLVNMGRMNTTLNFFPEMRAQLRTYHAIPSLQAHQDAHAYKQLQDAPRLKSILKGGADDRSEPNTLAKVKQMNAPRTNPVNLIFLMCTAAQKVAELHFPRRHEFHDLIMRTDYSSQSRATAFLWLMWFYLESDFTEEGCEENPFGPGVDYGLHVANQGVPELQKLTPEEIEKENVDSPEEVEFGLAKQKTRAKILEMDQAYLTERETKRGKARLPLPDDGPAILPRIRPSKHESDMDSTRSTPPPRSMGRGGTSARRGAPLKYQIFEGSSPAPQPAEGVVSRKPRPPTAHQLAVERNRNQRVEYILDRGLRKEHHKARRARKKEGALWRVYKRLQAQEDPFDDSDDDSGHRNLMVGGGKAPGLFKEKGMGGLSQLAAEPDDFGEQVSAYAAALRRVERRVMRWRDVEGPKARVMQPVKRRSTKPDVPHFGDVTMGDADVEDGDQTMLPDDDHMQTVMEPHDDNVEQAPKSKKSRSPTEDKLDKTPKDTSMLAA